MSSKGVFGQQSGRSVQLNVRVTPEVADRVRARGGADYIEALVVADHNAHLPSDGNVVADHNAQLAGAAPAAPEGPAPPPAPTGPRRAAPLPIPRGR